MTANAGGSVQGAAASLSAVLGPGNAALIVTGLMLPAGGALARTVALFRIGDPIVLGVTLPAGELAAIGFLPVGLVAIGLMGAIMLRRRMCAQSVPFWPVVAVIVIGVTVITVSTGGDLLQTLLSLVVTLAALWLANRESWRPVRGGSLAVALVAMYAVASIAYGASARLGPALQVTSSDASLLPNGAYLRLAEDADWLYLGPCVAPGAIVQAPKRLVAVAQVIEPPLHQAAGDESDPYRFCP